MNIFDNLREITKILHNGMDVKWRIITALNEAETEYKKECEKIYKNCNYTCTMQQDMELIKREANEGYEPYKKVVRAHELQLKHCPKICPKYKEV
jgi:hypothetical protein